MSPLAIGARVVVTDGGAAHDQPGRITAIETMPRLSYLVTFEDLAIGAVWFEPEQLLQVRGKKS